MREREGEETERGQYRKGGFVRPNPKFRFARAHTNTLNFSTAILYNIPLILRAVNETGSTQIRTRFM